MSQSPLASPPLSAIATRLRAAKQVAIFTHQRPDPDALGSQAAAGLILQRLGAAVTLVHFAPPPPPYLFLQANLPGIAAAQFSPEWAASATFDTLLAVDTCTYQQLEPARDYLRANAEKVVALDHHLSRDALGPWLYTDTSAAACVEIVAELARELGLPLDKSLADPLLAGLVADTGWFRFDSVTPRTHRLAADLIAAGAEPNRLYERLQQTETASKLALMQRALASLRWSGENRFACMLLRARDFQETGAMPSQTEGLVDLPLQVASVSVAALVTEMGDGQVRASLRSKHHVDVNALCRQFGGGGHAKAAGCRFSDTPDHAVAKLEAAVLERL